jgi:hypothetical protein
MTNSEQQPGVLMLGMMGRTLAVNPLDNILIPGAVA